MVGKVSLKCTNRGIRSYWQGYFIPN